MASQTTASSLPPLRLLVATGLFPPETGGPATYSKLLHDKLGERGFEVTVLPFSSVRHLPKGWRHFSYLLRVIKLGRNADVIYAQDPVSVGYPAMLAARYLKKPLVVKIVGDYAWEQGVQRYGVTDPLDDFSKKHTGYRSQVLRLKRVERKVAGYAKMIVTPSAYLKRIVSNWGVPENKIRIIYNSFSFTDRTGRKDEARRMLYVDGKVIFSAGRLVPWKGFDALIRLMPTLLPQFPDLQLLIAGEGPDFHKLKALIEELHLETRVALLGRLPQEALFPYMKAADVFVLNTGYEGLSHILLEAMALGVPVVTTAVGGNPELIGDRKEGLLVPFGDSTALAEAISRVLGSGDLARSLGAHAKEKLKKFNETEMLNELSLLLRDIR
jgi:glycosyltransferase involved in cell wall biosynthesis